MFPRGGLRRRRYLMSALFCTREFSSATPEDRDESRPREEICKSRRLPQGRYIPKKYARNRDNKE